MEVIREARACDGTHAWLDRSAPLRLLPSVLPQTTGPHSTHTYKYTRVRIWGSQHQRFKATVKVHNSRKTKSYVRQEHKHCSPNAGHFVAHKLLDERSFLPIISTCCLVVPTRHLVRLAYMTVTEP